MTKFGTSQSVHRVEDQRFVTGKGHYLDDINLPGQVYGFVVRSPIAHARIGRLDASEARRAPGVLAVLTGPDQEAAGVNPRLPCEIPMNNRDGSQRGEPERPMLAWQKVRHVGDPVAFVVAESLAAAKDAAELIEVEYEELDAVVDTAGAAAAGQALVHDNVPDNLVFDWDYGDEQAVTDAVSGAAHVTRLELINNRVVANSMEPRGVLAHYDSATGRLTAYAGTQGGWALKDFLAQAVLQGESDQVRVITPDVGGGFGMKGVLYPEYAMAALAARQLERPVKWVADRSEGFLSDAMGRDHVTRAELAFDDRHRIIGMRVDTTANMGAYLSLFAPFIPTGAALKVLPGVYDVKRLYYRVKGVMTNTVPVDAYRGAGRPESIYVIERLMDQAARDLGVDRIELRRRNFIPDSAMPFTTAVGETYDSGEFGRVLDRALEQADWSGFPARREQSRQRGKRRGIGLCYYIESTMGDPEESAAVRFTDTGEVEVLVGTQSNGQGHETAYTQILSERLGVPFDRIRVIQGDTDAIPMGGGTGGSRSVTAEGWALVDASQAVIERGKDYAAQILEAAVADIEFRQGDFRIVGTDRSVDILSLAQQARTMAPPEAGGGPGLDSAVTIAVKAWTFPNGCHIAEVEVDPDTGVVEVVDYSVVDDFGRLINPMLVAGQVHGGVVQGIGQALLEHVVYDETGQLLSGAFTDYTMPRADTSPAIRFATEEIPCAPIRWA